MKLFVLLILSFSIVIVSYISSQAADVGRFDIYLKNGETLGNYRLVSHNPNKDVLIVEKNRLRIEIPMLTVSGFKQISIERNSRVSENDIFSYADVQTLSINCDSSRLLKLDRSILQQMFWDMKEKVTYYDKVHKHMMSNKVAKQTQATYHKQIMVKRRDFHRCLDNISNSILAQRDINVTMN